MSRVSLARGDTRDARFGASMDTHPAIVLTTVKSLPPANSARLGAAYRLHVVGSDDTYWLCRRTAAGTHAWVQIDNVAGGAGGTEYVEDAVPPANPQGPTLELIRKDALASEVSADGDWVTLRGTGKGEAYVKHVDPIAVTGTFWQATQPVSGTFWQATQPVSGTFWQATQPVSGPLTDTQLRASAVPVSGPLTDTQLRASAVPVSGPLTDTQLRASSVPTQDAQVVADNAAFTDGTTKLFMAGYIFDESAGTALTENDAAAPRLDSKRASVFTLEDETTRGTRLTIKAASTAPVAADKAAVVAVSPNSLVAVPSGGGGVAALPVKMTAQFPATYVAAGSTVSSGALTANTEVILWSIDHAASATKTVKIHKIVAELTCTTAPAAAGTGEVRLYRGTAVGSAGSALTGLPTNPARGAAEASIRTNKPTITAATTVDKRIGWLAATAGDWRSWGSGDDVVYSWNPQSEEEPLTLPAATASSLAIAIIHSSTPTFSYNIKVWFTEE